MSIEPSPIQAAIERWQQGKDPEESFRIIFHHYSRIIYKFFAKKGFDEAKCEDLVQETFLRVHHSLGGFRGEATFGTWLFQVSANVYKNELRSRMAQKRDAQEVPLDAVAWERAAEPLATADAGILEELLTAEEMELYRRALTELPPQMRSCLELRLRDLKYREIAEVMGLAIDTVKSELFAARRRIQERVAVLTAAATSAPQEEATPSPVTSHNVGPNKDLPVSASKLDQRFLAAEQVKGASPHTVAAYRRHLQAFIRQLDGAPITPEALANYRTRLLGDGRGAASHHQALAAVRGFLSWLADTQEAKQLLHPIPPVGTIRSILKAPPMPAKACRPVAPEREAGALLEAAPTARDRAMLGVLLGGGLRVNELVQLEVRDFQLRDGGLSLQVTRSDRSRTLPLPREIARLLETYLTETGRTWRSPGYFFLPLPRNGGRPSRTGRLTTRAIEYRLRQLLKIAGLPENMMSPHSLRQTYATRLLQKGEDIEALQELLGHAHAWTTRRYLRSLEGSAAGTRRMAG